MEFLKKQKEGKEELNKQLEIKEEKIEDLVFINYGLKCENKELKTTIEKGETKIQILKDTIEDLQNDNEGLKQALGELTRKNQYYSSMLQPNQPIYSFGQPPQFYPHQIQYHP